MKKCKKITCHFRVLFCSYGMPQTLAACFSLFICCAGNIFLIPLVVAKHSIC